MTTGSRLLLTFCALLPAAVLRADPAKMDGFLEQHCVKCHGPEKQKGKLRLDDLAKPPMEAGRWKEVLEAIEYGDMPPKEEKRPEASAVAAFKSEVAKGLAGAGEAPALAVRRMNRYEYENTVHDLLGIDIPLAELLPEDSKTQGFDNVAEGMSFSSVLMEKYLEAANSAFDAVIRRLPPLPAQSRVAMAMNSESNKGAVAKANDGVIEKDGAFVDFSPGWPPTRFDGAQPVDSGLYKVKVTVWPHEAGKRTLTVGVFTGALFGTGKLDFQGVYDVTGDSKNPRIIEFTTRMKEGEAIHVLPWIYPGFISYRDKGQARPGIGMVSAETYGPLEQDFPSLAQKKLFGDVTTISMVADQPIYMKNRKGAKLHKVESSAPEADVERIIRDFVPKAFRRPVEKSLVDRFVELALGRLKEGRSFEESVRAGVCAVLCSPHFLMVNRDAAVDDYTIASRMSYFLWSSQPDEELMKLASAGKLKDANVRRNQVDRMLKDVKHERFIDSFTGQWLDLRQMDATTPDKKLYPEYDELLGRSMVRETKGFFTEVLEKDLPAKSFVDSDFVVVNERLADHYGIPGVKGHEKMQVVKLPADNLRGGVLTQGAIMKVTANGTASSPVIRGVWVLDRLMGQPVPPPPPGVPAVEPDIRGAVSLRDQLTKHTEDPSCARCHVRIDPVGFALEEFDPIGKHRQKYRAVPQKGGGYVAGLPVDSSGETPDKHTFTNFAGFRDWLASDEKIIARALAQKLMIYGCGRKMQVTDRPQVEAVVAASAKSRRWPPESNES
ncbi:MAG TPA: DUF1592 domain-containing protein [Luteolibacter sp.]|nr:DUF1592 domain-containing protein [Luteolibacter sp.]